MSLPPARNPRATASVLVGLLAVAAVPAGVVLSGYSTKVTLINSAYVSVPASILLGLYAIVLARRGRETRERTLGRSGGRVTVRLGRILGIAGLCVGITAGMALGFYGLLTLFAQ
jgi:hypothetical protein